MDPHKEEYVDRLYKWYLIQCKSRKITPKAAAKIGAKLLAPHVRGQLTQVIEQEMDVWGGKMSKHYIGKPSGRMSDCMRNCIKEALSTFKIKAKFGANGDISYKMSVWDKVKLWFVISFIIDYIENLLSD